VKFSLGNKEVKTCGRHFIARSANVIGLVVLKENSSVWFGATVRGDNEIIEIGENSNVQDLAVLHTDPGYPLIIGKGCTIGHKAVLHGCTIGDNTLVGINSVILNGAKIGENCLIGAGALIPENKEIPDGSLVMGMPGKIVKRLSESQIEGLKESAKKYVENSHRFSDDLKEIP